MDIIVLILIWVLVVFNIVAFYKVERLIKINKWWFPFFHLIIGYLLLWIVFFLVSLFFNFALFYVLGFVGVLLSLIYFTYLLTRLAWLRWYFTILWIIPVVNFFYYPYLYLRISKKFKKWVGSAILLFLFPAIYFPILIFKNKKDYLWVDTPVELSNKEIWIIYGIVVLLIGSFFIVGKYLENKNNSAQTIAIDVARKANLSQLSTALTMYFNDQWEYPDSLWKLSPMYLMDLPKDPVTHKDYFYKAFDVNWRANAWFLLAAKMDNPKDCNTDIYSIQKLEQIIKKISNNLQEKEKILNTNGKYHKWCYYVMISSNNNWF